MSTADTPFHSHAGGVGSTRWSLSLQPDVPRAYVLDMSFQPYLPQRWYLMALVHANGVYAFKVWSLHSEAACSLDPADYEAVLASAPVLEVACNTTDAAEVVERFERVVSNVMHNRLTPLPGVAFIWNRFATTDGTGAYAG